MTKTSKCWRCYTNITGDDVTICVGKNLKNLKDYVKKEQRNGDLFMGSEDYSFSDLKFEETYIVE